MDAHAFVYDPVEVRRRRPSLSRLVHSLLFHSFQLASGSDDVRFEQVSATRASPVPVASIDYRGSEYPNAVLLTLDGNVKLSTLGFRKGAEPETAPVQVIITELLPETCSYLRVQIYRLCTLISPSDGVILRKSGQNREALGSFVVNERVKFSCQEVSLAQCLSVHRSSCTQQSHIVELAVHDEKIHAFVTEYRLEFNDELDWLECVRLLEQAKSQLALRNLRLRENLKIATTKDIVPEEYGERTPASCMSYLSADLTFFIQQNE